MADVSEADIEKAKFAFEIYDTEGKGEIDAFYLGHVLRAVNLNPTEAFIEKLGGTKKKDEKKFTLEEFLPIFSQVKKDKDQGVYEDFIECLKLYDKAENGLMSYAELHHILLTLGEKLEEKEVEEVFKDCIDQEDDEGMIPYVLIKFKTVSYLNEILLPFIKEPKHFIESKKIGYQRMNHNIPN